MTEKQRKYLFLLARERGMDKEVLHEYVTAQTGKESLTEVTKEEAGKLITGLQEKRQPSDKISERQIAYIKGLGERLGWEERTIHRFIEKQYGITRIEWLSKKQGAKVIEGLKSILEKDKKEKGI